MIGIDALQFAWAVAPAPRREMKFCVPLSKQIRASHRREVASQK